MSSGIGALVVIAAPRKPEPTEADTLKNRLMNYMWNKDASKRISQTKLAKMAGCSRMTIFNVINDRVEPSLALADALAKALGVTIYDLFPDLESNPN